MKKSATDLMQEIVFAAVIDSIGALKAASKGLPNTLLRDLNAIHANTTFADLPPELQAAISTSVRSAFGRLLKEGYSVTSGDAPPPRPQRDAPRQDRPLRDGPRPDRPARRDPPRRGPGGGAAGKGPPRGGGGGGKR